MSAAAGIGVLSEKREMFGTVLIFVALGEGIAVYGILFAVLMLFAKF
jgi:V/A-type H+-transporting ATPase subunit K